MIANVNEEIIQYLMSFEMSREQAEIELQNLIENQEEVEFYHRMYINEKKIPNEKDKTVILTTYGNDIDKESEFMVRQQWLENNIDMTLKAFLESYTFDDSEILLRLAMGQNEVLAIKQVGSII